MGSYHLYDSYTFVKMSKLPKKLWRDAATVIVAARNASVLQFCQSQQRPEQLNNYNSKTNDYSLLMLKRHSQSNFMVNVLNIFSNLE